MIVRGKDFVTQRNIDVIINFHTGHGPDTITLNLKACNSAFSNSTHLSVADAIKLRDALNEVIGEAQ
jgi:hypothetical protein